MRKRINNNVYNIIFCSLVILVGVLILTLPNQSTKAVKDSTITCLNILIPSLFPFMVISVFLTECNLTRFVFALPSALLSKISTLDKRFCDLFFIGMIGGYPAAAKSISIMVKNHEINEKDAAILLCFCTNAGPSFLLTAVGSRMFLSNEIGLILYISSLLSSLSLLLIYSNKIKSSNKIINKHSIKNYSDIFVESVKSGCNTMTIICAFVIVFSVILSFLGDSLKSVPFVEAIIFGALEVTHGCISASYNVSLGNILLASGICGFGGLCVIFQIKSICAKQNISIRQFLYSRILSVVLNVFYTFLLLFTIPINTKQTFLNNAKTATPEILTSPLPMIMIILCSISFPLCLSTRKKSNFL